MEPFETLGRELRERWARADFDEDRFPELAAEALERLQPHGLVRQREVLAWAARTPVLPRQGDARFGQPPINLYRDDQLYVEALFWVDGTTAIHQHAFSGAFCVLEGSSVHVEYGFETRRALNDQLRLGALETTKVELLTPGQVRPIRAGDGFIHALFHLERPTLSLVVRTHRAPRHPTQYEYFPPGLAIDPFWKPESLMRRLALLDMLLETDHAELAAFTGSLLDGADVMTWALALQRMNLHVHGYDRVEPLLERAPARDPELVRVMREALSQERWSAFVVARRSKLTRPDLRFFLGLVLNVVGRARLLALVHARFPERDPADTVVDWLREMRDTPCEGGNALGLDLDDAGLWVVRQLLDGRSEAWIASEAARAGQPITPTEIGKLCFVLPFNSILGRLLDAR